MLRQEHSVYDRRALKIMWQEAKFGDVLGYKFDALCFLLGLEIIILIVACQGSKHNYYIVLWNLGTSLNALYWCISNRPKQYLWSSKFFLEIGSRAVLNKFGWQHAFSHFIREGPY